MRADFMRFRGYSSNTMMSLTTLLSKRWFNARYEYVGGEGQ